MPNTIYIIRHCDKPKNDNNPCCSKKGYNRSHKWKDYFKSYNITIYTTGFSTNQNHCIQSLPFFPNYKCQHSQRMLLTSYIIGKSLHNIHYNYCVGNEKQMIQDVMEYEKNDVLIVWQHEHIRNILDYLQIDHSNNINIGEYNQVIIVDLSLQKLNYDYLIEQPPFFSKKHQYNDLYIIFSIFFFLVYWDFL